MTACKRMWRNFWLLPISALLITPALAHHSTAQYDLQGRVSYAGTVTKFEWQNPHAWIWLMVPQNNGAPQEIGIECASPGALRGVGFKWDTVKKGDQVTVTAAPLRNGAAGGLLVSVKWPNGREIVLPFVGILSHGQAGGAGPPAGAGARAPTVP